MNINWTQRIHDARERRYFTKDDNYDAARWNSCATGEAFANRNEPLKPLQSPSFHFEVDGNEVPPATHLITMLGTIFAAAVRENAFDTTELLNAQIIFAAPAAIEELHERVEAA